MSTLTKSEWYTPGQHMPEVIGTPSGPEADFYAMAERCSVGNWPSEGEGKRILNAAGKTVSDLVAVVGTLRPSKPSVKVAPVAQRQPRTINVAINNPTPAAAPAVANELKTVAQEKGEINRLQELEKEFNDNQEMISRLGVTREQYLESAMRSDLLRRGIDPRSIGLGW